MQLIPVANYSRDMIGNRYTSGGSGDVSGTSSVMFKIGFACTKLRIRYANYQGTISGEALNLSTITVQSALQAVADSGTPVQATFGGSTAAVSLVPGQEAVTDWISGNFSAGQFVAVRTYATWPTSGFLPTGPYTQPSNSAVTGYTGTAGDNYVQHTNIPANANGSNQLLTAGAASAWYSTNGSYCYGPVEIEGYASDGVWRPLVALVGDSIMQGSNESSDMCGGAAVRAMISLGVPYVNVAKGGESAGTIYNGLLFSQRQRRIRDASLVIYSYGTNDISGNSTTFATLRGYTLNAWQRLAAGGAPIVPVTLLPRSTGTWTTVGGQTPNTNLAAYQAYNAWLRAPASAGAGNSAIYDAAQLGITIPMIIDPASYIETDSNNTTPGGPSNPITAGYWWCGASNSTAYTTDGTHPSTNAVLLMVPAFTAAAAVINGSKQFPLPAGTTYPASTPLRNIASGNVYISAPYQIPASGVPGATGTAQAGNTSVVVNANTQNAADELLNLVDRMIADGRASLY